MAGEEAVIHGLGIISGIFMLIAFKFRDSEDETNRKLAVFFFFIGLVFLNLLTYSVFKISQQSLSYLVAGIMNTALLVMMWTTLIMVLWLGIQMFKIMLTGLWSMYKQFGRRRDL